MTNDDIQSMSPEEERDICQEIHETFPDVVFPKVRMEPAYFYSKSQRDFVEIEGQNNLMGRIGDGDDIHYSQCSDQYRLFRHEVAVWSMLQTVKEMPEMGQPDIRPTVYQNGRKMSLYVDFPEAKMVSIKGKDKVRPRIIGRNSTDLSMEYHILMALWQQVCSNGMMAPIADTKQRFSQKHRISLDPGEVAKGLLLEMGNLGKSLDVWKEWAKRELAKKEFVAIWEEVPFGTLGDQEAGRDMSDARKEILALPIAQTKTSLGDEILAKKPINAWALHNAMTQYLTHSVDNEQTRIDRLMEVEKIFSKTLNPIAKKGSKKTH